MTTTPQPASPTLLARVAEAVWVGVPVALRRVSAGLAVATVDGLYLAVRPAVGVLTPAAAGVLGVAFGALHPGFEVVYTESLLFLVIVAMLGALSGALGLYLVLGFVLGDLLLGDHPLWQFTFLSGSEVFGGKYGSWLVSYLLLALLAVGVPIAAKSLASEFALPPAFPRPLRALVGLGAMVGITGLLVFVWVQSAPLLVRPIFVWADRGQPTVEAIEPLQERGGWIVAAAMLAATGRAVAQGLLARAAEPGAAGPDRLGELVGRFRTPEPVVPLLSRVPLAVRLVARAVLLTVLMSGLFAAVWQAVATFLVLLVAQLLASPLVPVRLGVQYTQIVNRIPRIVRVIIVVVPVYLVGTMVLGYYLGRGELIFIPFLLLMLLAAVLMTLLSPTRTGREEPTGAGREGER